MTTTVDRQTGCVAANKKNCIALVEEVEVARSHGALAGVGHDI